MKNKIISGLLIGATLVVAGAFSAQAAYQPLTRYPAEVEYNKKPKEVPLIVIRFNEPDVAFQQPLYETMVKAFQVKPSAQFDIVTVSQKSSNKEIQKRYDQVAADNTNKVLATFNEIGMPVERLSVSNTSESVKSSEVRIFVH